MLNKTGSIFDEQSGALYDGLILILTWKSNHTPSKVWYEMSRPFPNFNICTTGVTLIRHMETNLNEILIERPMFLKGALLDSRVREMWATLL